MTAQAAAGVHRGGTLRVVAPLDVNEIDPAKAYDGTVWNLLSVTNDGLVGFKRAGGGAGTQLVPNLATSVPTPTDGGKTYTFHLRKGIRFSNGSTVTASDVRSTFERLFKGGTPRPDYYALIRGGSACIENPKTCDLSEGIVTDDKTGTVTFNLTAPHAEFLHRLAIPFGSILPSGTPTNTGKHPVPATGPYVIETATPNAWCWSATRYFHVWDASARPERLRRPDRRRDRRQQGQPDHGRYRARRRGRHERLRRLRHPDWPTSRRNTPRRFTRRPRRQPSTGI